MMATLNNIKRLKKVIEHNTLNIFGVMPYDRVTDAIILFAQCVHEYPGEGEDIWFIESGHYSPDEIITGAYWHFIEWHAGQDSKSYAALCALGDIYSPNMDLPDKGNDIYTQLGFIAKNTLS